MAHNTLQFYFTEKDFALDDRGSEVAAGEWHDRFRRERFSALYDLGFSKKPAHLDAAGTFLYRLADAFAEALADSPDLAVTREKTKVVLPDEKVQQLLDAVPFTLGSQFIDAGWIENVTAELQKAFEKDMQSWEGSVSLYLSGKSQHLKAKERIFFHLVERRDAEFPFAFLATYATKDEKEQLRHMPLRYALQEYKTDRSKLLELLGSLNGAGNASPLIDQFITSGELFHPLQLTADEAYELLKAVPAIEQAGIVCRIPNWWRKKSRGLGINVKVGGQKNSFVGLDSLVSMKPVLTADGVPLTKREIEKLLAQSEGLAFIKGKWTEVNHERLRALLAQIEELGGDITLLDALRLPLEEAADGKDAPAFTHTQWLGQLMKRLRNPGEIRTSKAPESLQAVLRPYQQTGYSWLDYMGQLGLGACLADDMGLGKTVQVLAFLEQMRRRNPDARALLIVPASLLGNWEKEAEKFAPEMPVHLLHGRPARQLDKEAADPQAFLTVTTYGMASRLSSLQNRNWDAVILDEAQAIKNPKTKQAQSVHGLKSPVRIALTGTPIENDLVNLWSLFDFLNKGLLGSMNEFRTFTKGLEAKPDGYSQLRNLIAPFMLRRMKTDKSIISDLPDKIEEIDYVSVTRRQAVLYAEVVEDITRRIEEADAEDNPLRRGAIVLQSIAQLKQICNHPAQYLGQPVTNWKDSGKFEMLGEIARTIAQNRERVLVFTQFRQLTPYLDAFLEEIFGVKGFVLHGGIPAKKRTEITEAFQSDRYYPYIVLSVKAGGTGLNLTNANHVIHFDRWWNPAVENQATDRAFRIGQEKNVMVHKLVCKGTIEEKIDEMITAKKELAESIIGSGGEKWITQLPTDELVSLMQLKA